MDRFLHLTPTIYPILRDAHERFRNNMIFSEFWKKCGEYLVTIQYPDISFMEAEGAFYNSARAFWSKEFTSEPSGLDTMFGYFRACFGIEGNEDYCITRMGREAFFNWYRMRDCLEDLNDSDKPELSYMIGIKPEWSKESQELLRNKIEEIKTDSEKERSADTLLAEIREKNRERELSND